MENYISRQEHDEFARRMEDEHKRTSHRLTELEETVTKTQARQGERLEELESRDGKMWRKVSGYVVTAVIGIVLGYIFTQIGM